MISFANYEDRLWDFAVIGAGPAGALAAYLLARQNQKVLLIDQADFPRKKVCGGCFSSRALHELKLAGLENLTAKLGAKPIHSLLLASGRHSAKIQLPQGASLSRKQFDFALIQAAQAAGAVFFSKTRGVLKKNSGTGAQIQIFQNGNEYEVRAKTVFISDGLMGDSLKNFPAHLSRASTGSLIGISAVLNKNSVAVQEGTVFMACGRAGYAGLVMQEDGKIETAAAVQPSFLKAAGTPCACVEKILAQAGFPETLLDFNTDWQGTPPLLRRRNHLAGPRFFILGDASGYIEPFTGEGIYWALLQARKLVSLLEPHHFEWNETLGREWQRLHSQIMNRRRRICRLVTLILKSPFLCGSLICLLNYFPQLAAPLIQYIHGSNDD